MLDLILGWRRHGVCVLCMYHITCVCTVCETEILRHCDPENILFCSSYWWPVHISRHPQTIDQILSHFNHWFKGTVSSRSEQTFNRAWNQCPILRWTQWLKITGSFIAVQQQQCDLIMWGIIFSHWVNVKLALRFHALFIMMTLYF